MVSLRKRPREERIQRLLERQMKKLESEFKRAKGRKPWAQKKLQRFMQWIAAIEVERLGGSGGSAEDWRSLGHCGDWPTLKSRRRRRQRDAAAERRAMARYLAERPGPDIMEEGRRAQEEKRRRR